MKKFVSYLVLVLLLGIPFYLWLTLPPFSVRFGSLTEAERSVGQLLGLFGMVLFSLNLFLSARLPIFDKFFDGLNNLYLKHHAIGGTALILLLFHPLSLTLTYLATSAYSAATFLVPSLSRPDIIFGEIALGTMITALLLTFYGKIAYHVWKFTHKFLGVAFSVAFLHLLKVTSDVSASPALRTYMIVVALVGITAYLYRAVFGRFLVTRLGYFVRNIRKLTPDVYEISLEPEGKKLDYSAGQFVFVRAVNSAVTSEEHPFSIVSIPAERNLKLIIKSSGDYTAKLNQLLVGTKVEIEGPFGKFSPRFWHGNNFIFIAGGIGITPFFPILEDLKAKPEIKVDLYYSVHDPGEIIYEDKLRENKLIHFFLNVSSLQGRLDMTKIIKSSGSLVGKKIFICGPSAMNRSFKEQLVLAGVLPEDIVSEEFGF